MCEICNRCLCYTNVKIFDIGKYNDEFITKLTGKLSIFDGKYYICRTCNSSVEKPRVFCHAVANGLF